jgi:hypothetical protein
METLIIAMCLIVLAPVYVGLFTVIFPKKQNPSGSLRPKNPPAAPRRNRPWRKTFFTLAPIRPDEAHRRGLRPRPRTPIPCTGNPQALQLLTPRPNPDKPEKKTFNHDGDNGAQRKILNALTSCSVVAFVVNFLLFCLHQEHFAQIRLSGKIRT